MDRGLNNRQFSDEPEDHTTTSENVADSPVSDDDATVTYARSPKKSRRSLKKRVVTVPISGGDGGSRSKTEVYPPADSWAWRKYGQKPIKGSPYPRGYYRCSSSKGCPARKQVERSHQDPTVLLVTYSHDHNHPVPATNKHHHITAASAAASVKTQADEVSVSPDRPEPEPHNDFPEFTSDFGWLSSDMCSAVIDCPALVGPTWSEAEAATMLPIGEEDESLFGDLGDLPEYSSVFRRNIEYDGIVA